MLAVTLRAFTWGVALAVKWWRLALAVNASGHIIGIHMGWLALAVKWWWSTMAVNVGGHITAVGCIHTGG